MSEVQPGQLWRHRENSSIILFLGVDHDCKDWFGKPAWRVMWWKDIEGRLIWIPMIPPHWPLDPVWWTQVEGEP